MPRSDLLLDLVDAERRGDRSRFKALVESIIAEERANQHHLLADRLSQLITTNGGPSADRDAHKSAVADLFVEVVPGRRLSSLELSPHNQHALAQLIEEHQRADLLASYGIAPRHRLLLEGAPGNGKTSVAEALASELMLPFYVLRYEGVISSFLGETAGRLDAAFSFARTRRCVLFVDEFDTIAKERGDAHETGEIKRVVSTLLLQIDSLPSHVILVGATNHSELLDRAAWRRFEVRLHLDPPSRDAISRFFRRLMADRGLDGEGLSPRTVADHLAGSSYSDVEELVNYIARRSVLESPGADIRRIEREALNAWRQQAGR